MKDAHHITPAEFQIIRILWNSPSPRSVSEVKAELVGSRPLAYTTVMTLLDKLARKRSVDRVKRGKAYFYHPRVSRRKVLDRLISEFTQDYFHGSRDELEQFLQETDSITSPGPSEEPELRVELL